MKAQPRFKNMRRWGLLVVGSLLGLLNPSQSEPVEGASLGGPSHIGTFEGSTTFTTGSSNGVNPGLYLEVMDKYGNYTEYTSEDGVITLPDTQEGAYVTQAKLLGKTKYRDEDTGELLDQWEDGRNLTLESVQMPVLTTTGKNLMSSSLRYDVFLDENGLESTRYQDIVSKEFIQVESSTSYGITTFYQGEMIKPQNIFICEYDNGKNFIKRFNAPSNGVFKTNINTKYIKFSIGGTGIPGDIEERKNIFIELEKTTIKATAYEPYKSNILSTSEDVVLRAVGEVRDELNLLTGEVINNVGKFIFDGTHDYGVVTTGDVTRISISNVNARPKTQPICDKLKSILYTVSNQLGNELACIHHTNDRIDIYISTSKCGATIDEIKTYLTTNPITVQYQLKTESVKTVGLNSTYSFQPVMNREVYISGNILPLVCSVTIPTEPLTFVLNPNAEADQQFIAPEFTITNHTPTSIYLELSRFEQLTQVLTDVLPEAHDDWSQLDRAQSKEMALALVPQPSAGWLALEEGPRYVAEDSNYYLGEVKANSSVDFTFTAHHGRAFVEALNPQYRLSFVFDFFDR